MHCACVPTKERNDHDQDTQFHHRRKVHVRTGSKQVGETSAWGHTLVERLSLLSILHMKCTDVHAVTSTQLYRLYILCYSAVSSSAYKLPTKLHYMS